MKLLTATLISLAVIASASAQDSQAIKITRRDSQTSRQGPATLAPVARPRPSQGAIGDFAPKLAELTDDVLYGDVWERLQLSKRDRSLVTVSALIAMNRPDQLRGHLVRARENGVTH